MKKIIFFEICFLVILFSCENDLETIRKVTYKSTDPDERTIDLKLHYTDSGFAKVELNAKLAESYSKPIKVVKLKDGVKVKFFNSSGEIESILTSLYGEIRGESEMMVRDSVRLFNIKMGQCLETEELFWNQKTEAIHTDRSVIVRSKDGIFFGEGIRTTQDFLKYEFIKPRGKIKLN